MKINSKTPEILSLAVESYKREKKFFYRFQLDISCFYYYFQLSFLSQNSVPPEKIIPKHAALKETIEHHAELSKYIQYIYSEITKFLTYVSVVLSILIGLDLLLNHKQLTALRGHMFYTSMPRQVVVIARDNTNCSNFFQNHRNE